MVFSSKSTFTDCSSLGAVVFCFSIHSLSSLILWRKFARFAATTSSFIIFYVLRVYKKGRFFGYPYFYRLAIPVYYLFLHLHRKLWLDEVEQPVPLPHCPM